MSKSEKEELIRLLANALHYEPSGVADGLTFLDHQRNVTLAGTTPDDTLTALVRAAAERLAKKEVASEAPSDARHFFRLIGQRVSVWRDYLMKWRFRSRRLSDDERKARCPFCESEQRSSNRCSRCGLWFFSSQYGNYFFLAAKSACERLGDRMHTTPHPASIPVPTGANPPGVFFGQKLEIKMPPIITSDCSSSGFSSSHYYPSICATEGHWSFFPTCSVLWKSMDDGKYLTSIAIKQSENAIPDNLKHLGFDWKLTFEQWIDLLLISGWRTKCFFSDDRFAPSPDNSVRIYIAFGYTSGYLQLDFDCIKTNSSFRVVPRYPTFPWIFHSKVELRTPVFQCKRILFHVGKVPSRL